ncbi:MAG: EAL domain-containing protein [Holophagales bacterium]|nr:MAG: EAL domain-containing protein [Holophagales bacterium]
MGEPGSPGRQPLGGTVAPDGDIFRAIIDHAPIGIWLLRADGHLAFVNKTYCDAVGIGEEQFLAAPHYSELYEPETAARCMASDAAALAHPGLHTSREHVRFTDGRLHEIEILKLRLTDEAGAVTGLIGLSLDVTERIAAEDRLRLLASVFENLREGAIITDPRGTILDVNPAFTAITGYTRDEALGQSTRLLNSGRHHPEYFREMWEALASSGRWSDEVWNRRKDGSIYPEWLSISAVRDADGAVVRYVAVFSDISRLKRQEQEAPASRAPRSADGSAESCPVDRPDGAGARPRSPQRQLHGGRLPRPRRLQADQRPLRARRRRRAAGGDRSTAHRVAARRGHRRPSRRRRVRPLAARPRHGRGSRGGPAARPRGGRATRRPDHRRRAGDRHREPRCLSLRGLRCRSRRAAAPRRPGDVPGQARRAEPLPPLRSRPRPAGEGARRAGRAVAAGARSSWLELHYQPEVNMRTGELLALEGLARWRHPERGLLLPGDFLPDLEGSDIELAFGDWVIAAALDQLLAWRAEGLECTVSVNVVARHLLEDGFVRKLERLLAERGPIPAGKLQFEVLESFALTDLFRASEVIESCRRLGVSFAIDDFGTGYSSLTYLRRLPVEALKIDQSFVRNMLHDPGDLVIVDGVVALGEAFGRTIVAEGVETVEHGLALLRLGCEVGQGHGIAHPMPAAELRGWAASWVPDVRWRTRERRAYAASDLPLLLAGRQHEDWIEAIESFVRSGSGAIVPPLDATSCPVGSWLAGSGRLRHAHRPELAAVVEAHQQAHDLGCEIVARRKGDDLVGAEVLLDDLHRQLDTLLESLRALQIAVFG